MSLLMFTKNMSEVIIVFSCRYLRLVGLHNKYTYYAFKLFLQIGTEEANTRLCSCAKRFTDGGFDA